MYCGFLSVVVIFQNNVLLGLVKIAQHEMYSQYLRLDESVFALCRVALTLIFILLA